VKNENLKKVKAIEEELHSEKKVQVRDKVSTALKTHEEMVRWTKTHKQEIEGQDDQIQAEKVSLKLKMTNRQKDNVQELISQIQNDIQMNQNVIKHCDQ